MVVTVTVTVGISCLIRSTVQLAERTCMWMMGGVSVIAVFMRCRTIRALHVIPCVRAAEDLGWMIVGLVRIVMRTLRAIRVPVPVITATTPIPTSIIVLPATQAVHTVPAAALALVMPAQAPWS